MYLTQTCFSINNCDNNYAGYLIKTIIHTFQFKLIDEGIAININN